MGPKTLIKPGERQHVEFKGTQRAAQITRLLQATGATMRMDRFRESIGPDHFDYLLTEYMNARLAKGYQIWDDTWKQLVTIGRPSDMLNVYIERVGAFANLDQLAKTGGVFQEIDTPSDAEISYSCSGWGNLIVADFKTIRTDRLGWFKKVSEEAGKAAVRTFHAWLFGTMLQANPTVDDGNSLFDDTNHKNDLDSAGAGLDLNYTNLASAWEKMRAQTDDNGEPIFVRPAWIVCGEEKEINAETLLESEFNPDSANRERNFFRGKLKGAVVSPYLGTDWYLWADPATIETFEVGFLDGNIDPGIFMLNPDISDTYFKTKKTMWRIEHYYGGNWIDWRGVVRGSQNV